MRGTNAAPSQAPRPRELRIASAARRHSPHFNHRKSPRNADTPGLSSGRGLRLYSNPTFECEPHAQAATTVARSNRHTHPARAPAIWRDEAAAHPMHQPQRVVPNGTRPDPIQHQAPAALAAGRHTHLAASSAANPLLSPLQASSRERTLELGRTTSSHANQVSRNHLVPRFIHNVRHKIGKGHLLVISDHHIQANPCSRWPAEACKSIAKTDYVWGVPRGQMTNEHSETKCLVREVPKPAKGLRG